MRIARWFFALSSTVLPVIAAMPAARENALIAKHCTVCHTDAIPGGGLTLEHFDAAQVDPSLAAMLLSKVKNGALGAAGLPLPDKATAESLSDTLAAQSAGDHNWTVVQGSITTATILRELPDVKKPGGSSLYRLAVACDATKHEGTMQLSWAPLPKAGTFVASLDGKAPMTFELAGSEKMAIAGNAPAGPSAIVLNKKTKIGMPAKTLEIRELFPHETISFPFGALSQSVRQALSQCF